MFVINKKYTCPSENIDEKLFVAMELKVSLAHVKFYKMGKRILSDRAVTK